jgi:hypothetical protein
MKILRKDTDLNILLNTETDFQTNLGWEENLKEFETEVLNDIINPIENYETVRYIHKPYTSSGVTQTDIWFYFYFQSGGTYVQDYTPQGISSRENENMLKQATESFFRLEFFKTPGIISGTTLVCEPPTRQNRKLIFAKNLSLPLGEKMFYNPLNGYIHLPVFRGSNYSNKENMYFFWFQDESVLTETNLSGTTTGNTFFMTAKFYNAKDGTIIDFTNDSYSTGHTITEQNDMYYQVDINKTDYSYQVYFYNGVVKCEEVGLTNKPIMFFERGGGTAPNNILYHICSNVTPTPTVTPTNTPTPTPTNAIINTSTPTPTPTPTRTPLPSPEAVDTATYYYYRLGDCQYMGYSYTAITFGVSIPGCTSDPGYIGLSDGNTSYYVDETSPCGFSSGHTYSIYGKSLKTNPQIAEGKVFTIDGQCLSVVHIDDQYVPPSLSTISLDGLTPETGNNPCFDCQPPFTGFSTYYIYSGITCDNDETFIYSILPYALNNDPTAIRSPQIGQLYLYHEYDINGTLINPGNSCVEITGYIGEFEGARVVVPLPGGIPGSTYSVPLGPILTGGGEIDDCTECIPHWNITTVRCDGDLTDLIGYPIWSTTKPAIDSVIKTNANDGVCRKVTDVFPLKQIPSLGGSIGNMHTQIYYVSSSYVDCDGCL